MHSQFSLTLVLKSIPILICFPLVICALSPFFLLRWIFANLFRYLRPDLIRILPTASNLQTFELKGGSQARNLLISYTIQGKLDYEDFTRRVQRMVSTPGQAGHLLYPEFQMTYQYWMGYSYWVKEKDFNILSHIKRKAAATGAKLFEIEKEFLRTRFPPSKSPWDILLVELEREWVFLFKFHHALADGYSIFNALMLIADDSAIPRYVAPIPRKGTSLLTSLMLPFRAAYELALDLEWMNAAHPWKLSAKETSSDSRLIATSKHIPCSDIKRISKAHGVSFTSALMASVCGGIRRFAERNGTKDWPQDITTLMPFPLPKHGLGLTNEFTAAHISLPAGIKSDIQRLRVCEERLNAAKTSTAGATYYVMLSVIGGLPKCMHPLFTQPAFFKPLQLSNFPGPNTEVTINGQPITGMRYTLWLAGADAIMITIVSYNGNLELMLSAEPNLFRRGNGLGITDLVTEIEDEVKRMANISNSVNRDTKNSGEKDKTI